MLALAYRAGGFIGVSLLTGFAAAAAMFVVTRRVAKDLGGPALPAVGVIALIMLAPSLLARPHILALPYLRSLRRRPLRRAWRKTARRRWPRRC